jgi:hypothetical protein
MDYEGKGRPQLYLVITGGAQGEVPIPKSEPVRS